MKVHKCLVLSKKSNVHRVRMIRSSSARNYLSAIRPVPRTNNPCRFSIDARIAGRVTATAGDPRSDADRHCDSAGCGDTHDIYPMAASLARTVEGKTAHWRQPALARPRGAQLASPARCNAGCTCAASRNRVDESSATRSFPSTRAASASKAGRPARRSRIPIVCARRSSAIDGGHSCPRPGTPRSIASRTRSRRCRRQSGRDAVGVFGGGSLTNEKAYLLGKFARVALRTANIDYNGRFCMSSAAAAARPRRSASIAGCRFRSRTSRTPTSSCSSAATSPRRCRRSCSTSRRSRRTAAAR